MLCVKCNPVIDIPDGQYPEHVRVVHQNLPQAPIVMTPIDPSMPADIDPEFAKTWAEIQAFEIQKKKEEAQKPPQPTPVTPAERKPVELTYKYVGQAEDGHSVETLELDVAGEHFVIAFDPVEKKQVEVRGVANLKPQEANVVIKPPVAEVETPIEDLKPPEEIETKITPPLPVLEDIEEKPKKVKKPAQNAKQ